MSLYEARGEFQLNVEFMRRAGLGRLYEEFLRLKQRLAAEGLFDPARKRPLPRLPRDRRRRHVPAGRRVARCDHARCSGARLTCASSCIRCRSRVPVPARGSRRCWRVSARRDEVDVVLLVRGGGSIEDLWAFNEEAVARAIRACPLPVVVGVGHESDITIADFRGRSARADTDRGGGTGRADRPTPCATRSPTQHAASGAPVAGTTAGGITAHRLRAAQPRSAARAARGLDARVALLQVRARGRRRAGDGRRRRTRCGTARTLAAGATKP